MNLKSFTKPFHTSDLGLASIISSLGYNLVCLEKFEEKKLEFVFKNDKRLKTIVQKYWEKNLRIEPQAAFAHQKMLKSRIYNEK